MRLFGGQIFIHKVCSFICHNLCIYIIVLLDYINTIQGFDTLAKEPVMFQVHGTPTNSHSVQLDQV